MKIRHLAIVLLVSFAPLVARSADLSQFRYNGKTEETAKQSNDEIMSHLSNDKKAEYIVACIKIQQHDLKLRKASDPNAKITPLGPKLDGKTYAEILAEAKAITDVQVSAVRTAGPPADMQPGTLANQKLIQDAGAAIAKHLAAQGHHVEIRPAHAYVMSQPTGAPGQRAWTELWEYEVDGQLVKFAVDFKEAGDGADFSIRKL